MEHIFNIAINMDDETIKRQVAEKAEKEIMANLQREVGQIIFERTSSYYGYGKNTKGYNENCLSTWACNMFEDFMKKHKDEITAAAAKELADRLSRTKAAKAIFEN
jgi:hypothetical protein